MYIQKTKDGTKNLLEVINKFSEIEGPQICMEKLIPFQYI